MMMKDFAREARGRRIQNAMHSSMMARARWARWRAAARAYRPAPARGGFPYFRGPPKPKLCQCRECRKLDLMRFQGIPGARQLALPL